MKSKRFFLLFLIILVLLLPLAYLHRSDNPAFWRWSWPYALLVILYSGFVALCLLLYLYYAKIGLRFCLYLIAVYIFSFLFIDFCIGMRYFYSDTKCIGHPIYHHTLLPGKHILAVSDNAFLDHSYVITVNSQNLRSIKEIPLKKPQGSFRILALGDSFTEGKGVGDDETFCYYLERYLNSAKNNTGKYEILNAGVDSNTPILEYLYLTHKGVELEPDMVILFLDMSDLMQTSIYHESAVRDRNGNIERIPPSRITFRNVILDRFYYLAIIYRVVEDKIGKRTNVRKIKPSIGRPDPSNFKFTLSADQSAWKTEWREIYGDIDLIADFCKKKNIAFAVAIYPYGHQAKDYEWHEGRVPFGIPQNYTAPPDLSYMLEKDFKEKQIKCFNLFPAFRNYGGKNKLYYTRDGHWTKEGHALVARSLAEFLNKE